MRTLVNGAKTLRWNCHGNGHTFISTGICNSLCVRSFFNWILRCSQSINRVIVSFWTASQLELFWHRPAAYIWFAVDQPYVDWELYEFILIGSDFEMMPKNIHGFPDKCSIWKRRMCSPDRYSSLPRSSVWPIELSFTIRRWSSFISALPQTRSKISDALLWSTWSLATSVAEFSRTIKVVGLRSSFFNASSFCVHCCRSLSIKSLSSWLCRNWSDRLFSSCLILVVGSIIILSNFSLASSAAWRIWTMDSSSHWLIFFSKGCCRGSSVCWQRICWTRLCDVSISSSCLLSSFRWSVECFRQKIFEQPSHLNTPLPLLHTTHKTLTESCFDEAMRNEMMAVAWIRAQWKKRKKIFTLCFILVSTENTTVKRAVLFQQDHRSQCKTLLSI